MELERAGKLAEHLDATMVAQTEHLMVVLRAAKMVSLVVGDSVERLG